MQIKTICWPRWHAGMREVVLRRYGRSSTWWFNPARFDCDWWDKGQVNIAKQVIQERARLDIPIAGLQKNDKHQAHELLFGDPLEVVELSRNSQEFFLLQLASRMRCLRFAITFHRQLHSKNSFLHNWMGLTGPKHQANLMKHFKSLLKSRKLVWMKLSKWVCQSSQKMWKKVEPSRKKWNWLRSGGRKSGLPNKGDYDEP